MLPFYHNSESVEIACFLSRFPTFRIYGAGGHLGVDLTMFRAFPEEEVARAIELSGLSALVAERGALALCGENGSALSGGERQRVSIARAMLKNAPIVILDEATAYIDPENEAVIQQAVARLVKGKTVIVIAHRLSTITDADQIFVIQDGRVAGNGTHKELLDQNKLYQEMWNAHIGAKDGDAA